MYRLRIIAPLVISTLYSGLWSDSLSGPLTQLCTYEPHEYQISSQSVIFETTICLFSFPSEETFSHATPFEVLRQCIPIWSLNHSDKHCCYRNSVCDGLLRITVFLLCTPFWTKELRNLVTDIWHSSFYSHNRDAHCVYSCKVYYF